MPADSFEVEEIWARLYPMHHKGTKRRQIWDLVLRKGAFDVREEDGALNSKILESMLSDVL